MNTTHATTTKQPDRIENKTYRQTDTHTDRHTNEQRTITTQTMNLKQAPANDIHAVWVAHDGSWRAALITFDMSVVKWIPVQEVLSPMTISMST